jgi:coenzyme F420-reducing hydrogenase beta subunit
MISIVSRDKCCGCEACVQICPTGCISLKEDDEGFLLPQLDVKKCINCSKCDSVCPILNKIDPQPVLTCYAYRTKNEELLKRTSSGGFFSYAAEKVLVNRGVVFGAAFKDRNEVEHQFIESIEDLDRLRRSKYVQSRIGTSFIDCKRFLHDGR